MKLLNFADKDKDLDLVCENIMSMELHLDDMDAPDYIKSALREIAYVAFREGYRTAQNISEINDRCAELHKDD